MKRPIEVPAAKASPARKYGYLFGVVAAALVFSSWVVSNTLLEKAKTSKETAVTLLTAQRDYERYAHQVAQGRDALQMLAWQAFLTIPPADGGLTQRGRDFISNGLLLSYAERRAGSIPDLAAFRDELEREATSFPLDQKLATDLAFVSRQVSPLSLEYSNVLRDIESARTNRSLPQIEQLLSKSTRSLNSLADKVEPLRKNLQTISSELLHQASESAKRTETTAKRAQKAAFLLFFVGTAFALWGKISEANKHSASNDDDVPGGDG
jgi:hypothetical protein